MDVIHTALRVSDLDETTEFYEGVLGLDYDRQFTLDGVVNYYVGGESGAELQFKYDPDAPGDETVTVDGLDHVALGVDDTDAAFDRVVDAADPPVVQAPTDVPEAGARVAFVEDPDGYVVELVGPM